MNPIPIVGGYFHPLAKEVLECLPNNTTLVLVAEPNNPYDAQAIRVYVDLTQWDDLPTGQRELISVRLDTACECRGLTGAELLAMQQPCWVGFLPRSGAKTAEGGPGNAEVWEAYHDALAAYGLVVELGFTPNGKPCVVFENAKALEEDAAEWAASRPFNE